MIMLNIYTRKASKRVFSIVILIRLGVQTKDLCQIYATIIEPVLEYAAAV